MLFSALTQATHAQTGYAIPEPYRPGYAPGTYLEDNPDEAQGEFYKFSVPDFWFLVGDMIKILLSITGVIAVFFIVQAGFFYVTSGGQQEALDSAKNTLKWAFLGLLTVLFSYALIEFVLDIVTSINGTAPPPPPPLP